MPTSHDETIARLRETLVTLKSLDLDLREFGAGPPFGHSYEVHPVSIDEVEAKERQLGRPLPAEYRAWLLAMGCGAGPGYGLLPLSQVWGPPFFDEVGRGGDVYRPADITNAHIAAIPTKWDADPRNASLHISVDADEDLLFICKDGALVAILLDGPLAGGVFGVTDEVFEPDTALCGLSPEGALDLTYGGRNAHLNGVHPDRLFGFFGWYEAWLDRAIANRLSR
jgi:hypothetical protein